VETEQSYVAHSAVLTTTITDRAGGRLRITDFAPRFKRFERILRPAALYRRLEPLAGAPRVRVRIRPRFGYGAETAQARWASNSVRLRRRRTFAAPDHRRAARLTSSRSRVSRCCIRCIFVLGPDEPFAGFARRHLARVPRRDSGYWAEWARYLPRPLRVAGRGAARGG
jgi:hypothetical protein